MRRASVVAWKEFRGFLRSPLGFLILTVYALVSGLVFVTLVTIARQQILEALSGSLGRPELQGPPLQQMVVGPYFVNVGSLMLFVFPLITMRTLAGERSSRTLELLSSFPLASWQIVLGKVAGCGLFVVLLVCINALHMGILALIGNPSLLPTIWGLCGLLLFGVALVALGVFVSSLSSGQVEAAVLTLGLFIVLGLLGGTVRPGSSWIHIALANASPLYHYEKMGQGLISAADVLFFGAVILGALGLAIRGYDFLRWRG